MKDKEEGIFKGRIADLAERAFRQDIYTFTDFMGLSEQSVLQTMKNTLGHFFCFGGAKDCERIIVRFGDPERIGYDEPFPIVCLFMAPAMKGKEAVFGHRDVLGALMNLGIKRELLGDIIVRDGKAYIFCKETIAEYIMENLVQIRHDSVTCSIYEGDLESASPRRISEQTQVASLRLDALIAKVFKMSRQESSSQIREGRAFINGREIKNETKSPAEGDIISLRGHGRFSYDGQAGTTKKGNLIINISRFV